jgi:bidirectional [NiFe] hydrogenase diaphorase subunit
MDRNDLHEIAEKEQARRKPVRVRCCTASGCRAVDGLGVKAALEQSAAGRGLTDRVEVVGVGCLGLCGHGPLVAVDPGGHLFERVTPAAAPSILNAPDGGPVSAARCDPGQPFFASQVRIATRTSGLIDPESVEQYVAAGGYQALARVLTEMSPADVVAEVTRSGLRGRGGAGYPTGLKWATVARAAGGPKYVVGNGDEGDPGAFMDRSLMESDPHRILEGMAIAAFAVGAARGFLYVRAEYPAAVQRIRHAIEQARRLGVLGGDVLGSGFDFRIDVRIGAGAFVCGEETALMASVEGGRGTPRPRPPFPAESGLWGRPTLLNNVETFANVPAILDRGADWFAGIGTEKSKGTKVFALTGKVANTGLIEVPMGTTLRHVVEVMGGGVPGGRVKAVQTGGPSGGCVPASRLDTPVDYESLTRLGAIMGSGGMIVMDQDTNMVEVARFFMGFCRDESCGKCVPCRAGTEQMHRLLTKIAERRGTQADLDLLLRLCGMVRETSLCGLGQSAPNPVLSAVRYFGDEFKALLQSLGVATPGL